MYLLVIVRLYLVMHTRAREQKHLETQTNLNCVQIANRKECLQRPLDCH